MTWFLQTDIAQELRALDRSATTEQRERFALSAAANAQSKLATATSTTTADIKIDGLLTERPSFLAMLLGVGATTYRDIRAALASAASNPSVEQVTLSISSPGGHVVGLFETLAALETFPKPITVRASFATSAAYALAAMGGRIEATTPASQFGSIGVAAMLIHDDHVIDITSTDAPNKRPDPTTPEGKAVIRRDLDALHDLFVEAIAKGRTRAGHAMQPADVNTSFGKGSVFVAREAKKAGMIDSIARASLYAPESDEAAVERFLAVQADIDAGRLRQQVGESKEQFIKRCVRISIGARDEDDDGGHRGRVIELFSREPRAASGAAEGSTFVPSPAFDFGDRVALSLEKNFPTKNGGSNL